MQWPIWYGDPTFEHKRSVIHKSRCWGTWDEGFSVPWPRGLVWGGCPRSSKNQREGVSGACALAHHTAAHLGSRICRPDRLAAQTKGDDVVQEELARDGAARSFALGLPYVIPEGLVGGSQDGDGTAALHPIPQLLEHPCTRTGEVGKSGERVPRIG